jgi:hypothetical protein
MKDQARARLAILWGAAIAALGLITWGRIWLVQNLRDQGWFAKYVVFADRILAGDIPADRIGDVSPAYLWLMVGFRWLGLEISSIRVVQVVVLTAGVLFCALAAKHLGGWIAAVVAAALILGNRAALVTATELEPETLIFVLNAGALLCVVLAGRALTNSRHALALWGAAGALLGLSTVARPVAFLILALIALWALTFSRRALLALLIPALIPIVIVLAVNRSITGHIFIMQPGGQLYDGNNPLATGIAGVLPRVVADLDRSSSEPDYLHVAYRLVAARATGSEIDPAATNRYWTGKVLGFVRHYPAAELRLIGWKALLAIHHYDIYDLISTKRKSIELSRYPAIPFGLTFVLTGVALALGARRRELLPALLFVAATVAVLLMFNVSSRQRNALLVPLSVLGGVGAARIISLIRPRTERALLAFGAVMVLTPLLGIEGSPMREDAYNWSAVLTADALRTSAVRAREEGNRLAAARDATAASILEPSEPPLVSERNLRDFALQIAKDSDADPQRFDAAIALQKSGAWAESERILATLTRYRPLRENRAVSSVAYYRARAAMRLGRPAEEVRTLLDAAIRESPGDPHVLALRYVAGDARALPVLDAIHDPFTRDFALAAAYADAGDTPRADALLAAIEQRIPEWRRPAFVRHALRTAGGRSGSSESGR